MALVTISYGTTSVTIYDTKVVRNVSNDLRLNPVAQAVDKPPYTSNPTMVPGIQDARRLTKSITVTGFLVGPNADTDKQNLEKLQYDNDGRELSLTWRGRTYEGFIKSLQITDEFKKELTDQINDDEAVYQVIIVFMEGKQILNLEYD